MRPLVEILLTNSAVERQARKQLLAYIKTKPPVTDLKRRKTEKARRAYGMQQ